MNDSASLFVRLEVRRSMTACPDEASILSYGRGDMTLARRPGLASHIEGCDECRVLVKAVRRASLVDGSEVVMPAPIPADVAASEATPGGDAVMVATPAATRGGRALLVAACACVLVLLALLVRLAAH